MKLVDLDRNKLKKAAKRDRDRTFQIERGLQLESCECLNGRVWRELSDHIPLLARFTL
jgi:endonuclease/exonuclease/phosphatase family metal-dependent hydrolase